MDVPHGTIDFGRGFVGGDRPLQLAKSLLALAGQVQRHGAGQVALWTGSLIVRVEFHGPQGLNLGGSPHGNGAHCTVCSLLVAPGEVTRTQYRRARSSGAPINPMPPVAMRPSTHESMVLPSTITANTGPATHIRTVNVARAFPGRRVPETTACSATPAFTTARLNSN